jgi:hypothetical protein
MIAYLGRVLDALDQLGNAIIGGSPVETISAHSFRAAKKGNPLAQVVVDVLDEIMPNHGRIAAQDVLARAEAIAAIEKEALG